MITPTDIDLSPVAKDVLSRQLEKAGRSFDDLDPVEAECLMRPLIPLLWNALPSILEQVNKAHAAGAEEDLLANLVVPDNIAGLE